MARRAWAAIAMLGLTTGCMRVNALSGDGEGGAYVVSQRRFLGIGGAQTLVHCPRPDMGPAQCQTVLNTRNVAALPPADYAPRSQATSEMDLWGSLIDEYGQYLDGGSAGDLYDGGSSASDTPAPDCPAGAFSEGQIIPEGTSVTLLQLHPDDAYFGSEWEDQLPLQGTVTGDLHQNDACWLGGGFELSDGTSFYFYKAAFRLN